MLSNTRKTKSNSYLLQDAEPFFDCARCFKKDMDGGECKVWMDVHVEALLLSNADCCGDRYTTNQITFSSVH